MQFIEINRKKNPKSLLIVVNKMIVNVKALWDAQEAHIIKTGGKRKPQLSCVLEAK